MSRGVRVPPRGGYAHPYVLCWRGQMPENAALHGEFSEHSTVDGARKAMVGKAEDHYSFWGEQARWFVWFVVDRRSGVTLAEAY